MWCPTAWSKAGTAEAGVELMNTLVMPATAARMAGLGRVAVVAVAHPALAGAVTWAWLGIAGVARGPLEAALCIAPALLAAALAFTSQADRQQYVARLLACAAMLPILLMMWAGSQDPLPEAAPAASAVLARQPWIFFSGFAVAHAAIFVAAIIWLASAVTRVEAMPGSATVPAAMLVQRLRSLGASGVPFVLTEGGPAGEWVAALRLPANHERSHWVILRIDEVTHTVRVRERLGARGATPRNADEASLRGPGEAAFDPTRPDAQSVWSWQAQTTMIDPARLAATRLALHDGRAEPVPEAVTATATDPDDIVTLLCALVTRSGYAWQPLMGIGSSR